MEVDHNGCNGNSTNSNVRGKKRSGNHLDHVEDLPPEKSSTDVTSVSQRRHPTHFETLALLRKVMLATIKRRTQSEIERAAELTRVEREPSRDESSASRLSTIESTSSMDDDPELLEEPGSETEDVFEPNQ